MKDQRKFKNPNIKELVLSFEKSLEEQSPFYRDEESFEALMDFYDEQLDGEHGRLVGILAATQHPYCASLLIRTAQLMVDACLFDDAKVFLDKAELLDPTELSISLTRADIEVWHGRHKKALKILYKVLEDVPDNEKTDIYLEIADVYEDMEDYKSLFEVLKQALKYDSNNEEVMNRLWYSSELLEKPDGIVELLQEVIDKEPYNYLAWYNLGHAYLSLELFEKAIENFEYVIAIKEDFEDVYVDLGDAHMSLKQYVKAIDYYKESLNYQKPFKELFLSIGIAYEKLNDYKNAREYYRKAILLNTNYDRAYYRSGMCFLKENKPMQALNSLERAVKLKTNSARYNRIYIELLLDLEMNETALNHVEAMLKEGKNNRWKMEFAILVYIKCDMLVEALSLLNQAMFEHGRKPSLLVLYSIILFKNKKLDQSVDVLEEAVAAKLKSFYYIFVHGKEMLALPRVKQIIDAYNH